MVGRWGRGGSGVGVGKIVSLSEGCPGRSWEAGPGAGLGLGLGLGLRGGGLLPATSHSVLYTTVNAEGSPS